MLHKPGMWRKEGVGGGGGRTVAEMLQNQTNSHNAHPNFIILTDRYLHVIKLGYHSETVLMCQANF